VVRGRRSRPGEPSRSWGAASGPGGGGIALAPSSSIWRGLASSIAYRTARPPVSRPGWRSSRRAPSSAVTAVTSRRTACVEGHPRRCRSWTASRLGAFVVRLACRRRISGGSSPQVVCQLVPGARIPKYLCKLTLMTINNPHRIMTQARHSR
jgi:hypothetical protein